MRIEEVKKAIELAKKFIESADKLTAFRYDGKPSAYVNYGKDSGATRRASLDLTRQLSVMRKP